MLTICTKYTYHLLHLTYFAIRSSQSNTEHVLIQCIYNPMKLQIPQSRFLGMANVSNGSDPLGYSNPVAGALLFIGGWAYLVPYTLCVVVMLGKVG